MAHDDVAVEQACGLAGRRAVDGLAEPERELLIPAWRGVALDLGRQRHGSVTQLHPVHARALAQQRGIAEFHTRAAQRLAGAGDHAVARGVGVEDVERRSTADPKTLPLADREVLMAPVAAERVAAAVDDVPGTVARAAVAGQEVAAT